jgi:two-component system chemotaxis response regulator CheY
MQNRDTVKILVVDDVQTIRIYMEILLKSFGFKDISFAESGMAAMSALNEKSFDVILSDWHMAPVDGIELLRWVRKKPKLQSVSFLILTAEGTVDKVIDAIQSGVDDYLLKPISPNDLEAKLLHVLRRKKVL